MENDDMSSYIPINNNPPNRKQAYGEQLDFTRELLNKDDMKKIISADLQLYFTTFVKNMAISNFTEKDIKNMNLRFDNLKSAFICKYPPSAYTAELEEQFEAMRITMCSELTRARDGFERRMMATSINQNYNQSDISSNNQSQGGSGIMSRFNKFMGRR